MMIIISEFLSVTVVFGLAWVVLRLLPALMAMIILSIQKLLPHADRADNALMTTKCWWKAVFLPMYELDGISFGKKYDNPQTIKDFIVGVLLTAGMVMLFVASYIPAIVVAAIIVGCGQMYDDIIGFRKKLRKAVKRLAR